VVGCQLSAALLRDGLPNTDRAVYPDMPDTKLIADNWQLITDIYLKSEIRKLKSNQKLIKRPNPKVPFFAGNLAAGLLYTHTVFAYARRYAQHHYSLGINVYCKFKQNFSVGITTKNFVAKVKEKKWKPSTNSMF
jgi:hypothetical protein